MKKKILIVDDDPITIHLLKLILEPVGFETESAQNGIEAVELATQNSPDAVLLDVMMPMMDGFAVCKTLRAQKETAQLPIIILSTNAQARSVQQGMEAGATKYLYKPISRDTLITEIAYAIENKSKVSII